MKKLNFANEDKNDDDKLIRILKESGGQEPSEQFMENTMEKFLKLKAKQKIVYKPLKPPLYLMVVIGLILFVPIIPSLNSQIAFPDSGFELKNLFDGMAFQLDSWYAITPILLVPALLSVVWIELDLVKFRNPFN